MTEKKVRKRKPKKVRAILDQDVERYLKKNRVFSKTKKHNLMVDANNIIEFINKIDVLEDIKYILIQDKMYELDDNIKFMYADDTFLLIINNIEIYNFFQSYDLFTFTKKIFSYDEVNGIQKLNF